MQTLQQKQTKTNTFDIVLSALLIGLVFSATAFLNIKLPIAASGGLVHLGTAMLFIAAIMFGPKKGALAGAAGMGLFDVMGGWLVWAPITIVARFVQGWIVGSISHANSRDGKSTRWNVVAMAVSIPVMMAIYYVGEAFLYSNWIAPLASMPGDLLQNVIGLAIAIPVCRVLKKVPYFAK